MSKNGKIHIILLWLNLDLFLLLKIQLQLKMKSKIFVRSQAKQSREQLLNYKSNFEASGSNKRCLKILSCYAKPKTINTLQYYLLISLRTPQLVKCCQTCFLFLFAVGHRFQSPSSGQRSPGGYFQLLSFYISKKIDNNFLGS